jgi:hypothetical protein
MDPRTGKLAACGLTTLFFDNKPLLEEYPQPIASIIVDYKKAFQTLQLTILEGRPNNREEIGRCVEELERHFNKLISEF